MILVTGGAGFIGSNYLYKLYDLDPGQKVVCIDFLTYASNYDYIRPLIDKKFLNLEVKNIASDIYVDYIFKIFQPKCVVHFAAETHVDRSIADVSPFLETNVKGTVNLLRAASRVPGFEKFIYVSTDEVYGSLPLDCKDKFSESSPIVANNPYSASKAAGENFVRAFYNTYGVPGIITNCSNNYGPNQHREKLIPTVISHIRNQTPVPVYGNGKNIRDWLYVDDHCAALNLILEKGAPGERYNIGGGTELSNLDLINKIGQLLNHDVEIDFVTDRPGHDLHYAIDCTKIEKELGYSPAHTIDQGLEKTIEWYTQSI